MGIGYGTYHEFGSKGFFYAGNETSGVLLTLTPIVLYIALKKYSVKSIKFLVIILLCLTAAILLGTKSALLGMFVILLYIVWKYSKINKIYIISFVGLIIAGACYYIYNYFSFIVERFMFAFEKREMGWMALLSGRDVFLAETMEEFYNSNLILNSLGMGIPQKMIEIDFFDFLYISGYIGASILFLLWIINIRRSQKKGEIPSLIFFTNILLIGVSFIAGHIYSSAMAGSFIAIINILPLIDKRFNNIIKPIG